MGCPAYLACMLIPAGGMAAALVPVSADFGGLGVASYFFCKGPLKGPLGSCYRAGGVASDEDHLLEFTVTLPPSCRVVEPKCHPLPVESKVEGSKGLDGVCPVNCMEEVGVKVKGMPQFPFDAVRAEVE